MSEQSHLISNTAEVSPTWLTTVLIRSGALEAGRVVSFAASEGHGHWSQNAQLLVTYSPDAEGSCPTRLFLKIVNTDLGDGTFFLPAEVTYYTRDYIDLPDAPLVPCFDAAYDAVQQRYHLLLADVSETHVPAYDLKPTLAHGRVLATCLARLHAHWWGEKRLRQIKAPLHDAAHIQRAIEIGLPGLTHVQSVFAHRLAGHWPTLLQQIFTRLPARLASHAPDYTRLTLIHGDPNPGNMLVPRLGHTPLYLIDQQPFDWSLTTWLGVYDLAYVMALYWPSALRKALEVAVLRHYLAQLRICGVQHYAWTQLYEDYRLSVATTVPVAVEYMNDGGDPAWNEFRFGLLSRALTACDELACDQLL